MNLDTVRTFVAVADGGQFQQAATDLSITQQAVSKRITALEGDLGVRLFTRTARGARLTIDGQAFQPGEAGFRAHIAWADDLPRTGSAVGDEHRPARASLEQAGQEPGSAGISADRLQHEARIP